MRLRELCCVCGLGLLLTATGATAADDGSVSLFNGKDLSDWTVEGDAQFVVEDGLLKIAGGFGWLRSNARYTDFELHVEWRAEAEGFDSGVFVRTANDGNTPWPKYRSQVNMRHDQVGLVVGAKRSKPAEAFNPPGDWNTYDITCRDQTIEVKVNGKAVNKHKGCLKRKTGHIGFQAEKHKFAFRNVRIKELDSEPLFNGGDLTGWEGYGTSTEAWKVEDGVLVCTGKPKSGWLVTEKTYGDFDLKLDFKYETDANSGICIRATREGNPAYSGMELQIIDEDGDRYKGKLKDWQKTGALYGKQPPKGKHVKPAGQWNHIEVNCHGNRLEVWLNGHRIVKTNFSADKDEKNNLAQRAKVGHIGFQNYGDVVSFRNIRLRAKK